MAATLTAFDATTYVNELDAEDRAGRTDPYRQLASQLHVVAARAAAGPRPDEPPREP